MKTWLTVFVLTLSGCRTASTASFKVVDPARLEGAADASKLKIEKGKTIFVDASPVGNLVNPTFPAGAFTTPRTSITIVVRVAVDADGKPSVAGKSIADFSAPTPFTRACEQAIAAAVAQWKFEPAQFAVLEPQSDGTPLLVSSSATDTVFEIAFVFAPSGRVDSQTNRKSN